MTEISRLIQQLIQSGDWPHPDLLAAILAHGDVAAESLIAIISDPTMYWDYARGKPRWLPAYAMGLLGDLRAKASVPTLIELLYWPNMGECLEQVVNTLARIGLVAVEPTKAAILDRSLGWYPRSLAALSLAVQVYRDPEDSIAVLKFLWDLLRHGPIECPDDRVVYTLLAQDLADLQGLDALEIIQVAFQRGAIDEDYIDWPDAETTCRNADQRILQRYAIDFLPDYRAKFDPLASV